MGYTTQKISENFWAIEQDFVRSFLLIGPENALLVDTCCEGDIQSVCDGLTDKPITLLTTHSDRDHIGCDGQFPLQYLHPAELDAYERRGGRRSHARPLWDGDVFTAGDFELEAILVPGHTPGSTAFLERKRRFLLSGDTVQAHCIFMFGDGRSLPAFRQSIERLDALRRSGAFDTVYASHGPLCFSAELLAEHLALADELLAGAATPVGPAPEGFPKTVKTYRHGRVGMYY